MTTQCLSAQQEEQQLHIPDSWHCSDSTLHCRLCWSVATIQIWRSPQDGPYSKGPPDKGLAHTCTREPGHGEEDKRRNKRQTRSLVCFMYLLAGRPFLKFLSFKALPEAIRMSSVSNITSQEAGKEGDSSDLWPWERNNLALWCSLLLLFLFFFLRKLQMYDHSDHRTHFNEALQRCTVTSVLWVWLQRTEAVLNVSSRGCVDTACANLIWLLLLQPRNNCCIYCATDASRGWLACGLDPPCLLWLLSFKQGETSNKKIGL